MNIYPTEKRAFVIIPRKFKYIIAEILVKKNVRGGNMRLLRDFIPRNDRVGRMEKYLLK